MSTQPIPFEKPTPAELLQAKKRAEKRSDVLYIVGAALISIGLGTVHSYLAPIAAGFFTMLPPLLELAAGFIRGLRRTK
jgi:hypothetical protein